MTDNERIAKFMGMVRHEHNPTRYHYPGNTFDNVGINELEYSYSWDWIMPVVEKIMNVDKGEYGFSDEGSLKWEFVVFAHITSSIEKVYKAVVEFIKWFETRGAEQ